MKILLALAKISWKTEAWFFPVVRYSRRKPERVCLKYFVDDCSLVLNIYGVKNLVHG